MNNTIKCPYCCEEIPASATVCPYCGENLEHSKDGRSTQEESSPEPEIPTAAPKTDHTPSVSNSKPTAYTVSNFEGSYSLKGLFIDPIFKGFFDFRGKISRKQFRTAILTILFVMAIIRGLGVLAERLSDASWSNHWGVVEEALMLLMIIFGYLQTVKISVRRTNDIGISPYWNLLYIGFGLIPFLMCLFMKTGCGSNKKAGKITAISFATLLALCLVIDIASAISDGDYQRDDDSASSYTGSAEQASTESKTQEDTSDNVFVDSETGSKYMIFDDPSFGKGAMSALNFPDKKITLCLNTNNTLLIIGENYKLYWPQFTSSMLSGIRQKYDKFEFYAQSGQCALWDDVYRTESGRFVSKVNDEVCDIVIEMRTFNNNPYIHLYSYLDSVDSSFDIWEIYGISDCRSMFDVFKTLTNNIGKAESSSASYQSVSSSTSSSYEPISTSTVSSESLKSKNIERNLSEKRSVELTDSKLFIRDTVGSLEIDLNDIVRFGNMCKDWLNSDALSSFIFESSKGEFSLWRIGADNIFSEKLILDSWQPNYAGSDTIYEIIIEDVLGDQVNISLNERDLKTIINLIFD